MNAHRQTRQVLLLTGSSRSVDVQFGHGMVSKRNWKIASSFPVLSAGVNCLLGVHAPTHADRSPHPFYEGLRFISSFKIMDSEISFIDLRLCWLSRCIVR